MLWVFHFFAWLLKYVFLSVFSPGLWKVVAKFHSNPQQSYTAEFEVKEYGKSFITWIFIYNLHNIQCLFTWLDTQNNSFIFTVLPSFEVKLTPASAFFYVDAEELTVNIKAT